MNFNRVSIAESGAECSLFSVDSEGTILTRTLLSLATGPSNYSMTAVVTDRGRPARSARRRLVVRLLGQQDPALPYMATHRQLIVASGAGPGTRVGSLAAPGPAWYSLEAGNTAGLWAVEGATGELVVAARLGTAPALHSLTLARHTDTAPPESISVRVRVEARAGLLDSLPASPLQLSVEESSTVGEAVHELGNSSVGLLWRLDTQLPKSQFRLEPATGRLLLAAPLDATVTPRLFLGVTVTGPGGRGSAQMAVVVTVQPGNSHAPTFLSPPTKRLTRPTELGVPFHRVLAADPDPGPAGRLRYTLESGDPGRTFQLGVDTGLLSLAGPPRLPSYSLVVVAEDSGNPPRSTKQSLRLQLGGRQGGPPRFSQSVWRAGVEEGTGHGLTLLTLTATQHGSPAGLSYWLEPGPGSHLFSVDEASGEVGVAGQLDREAQQLHTLLVTVRDQAEPSSYDTATVLVTVEDENDHAPSFPHSCYPLAVPENTDLSNIHRFVAVDSDSGANGLVSYSLAGPSTAQFSIDAETGELSAVPLDREAGGAKHLLEVVARDGGSPPRQAVCRTSVTVIDRNDNGPVFQQAEYEVTVREGLAPGSTVTTVAATDPDTGPAATIAYSLHNGTSWLFGIDPDTGRVFTTGRLDRERSSLHELEVVAVDQGAEETQPARARLTVRLQDENDNAPEFTQYPFLAQVLAGHPAGLEITRLAATDADTGSNAELSFAFLHAADRERWAVESGSGVITARAALQPEEGDGLWQLEVVVSDGGSPALTTTGLVEIRVGPQPRVQLNFQQPRYSAELKEGAGPGTEITQVRAVRSDGRKQRVTYSFGRGNEDGTFEINSNNGLVSCGVYRSAALHCTVVCRCGWRGLSRWTTRRWPSTT